MIFAAGFGTRMGPLTTDRPKPLVPVAGRALIDHALDVVREVPCKVVNVHYRAAQMKAHLAGRDVAISEESGEILETGGGLRHALPLLGEGPVYTLNSDAVWTGENPMAELAAQWDPARMDALLLLIAPGDARGHKGGDFTLGPDGRISRGGPLIYSGAQIIQPEGLRDYPEAAFSLNRHWDVLLGRGRLYGMVHQGRWCDVGTPQGVLDAEAMLGAADV